MLTISITSPEFLLKWGIFSCRFFLNSWKKKFSTRIKCSDRLKFEGRAITLLPQLQCYQRRAFSSSSSASSFTAGIISATQQKIANATGTSQKLEIAYTGTRPEPGINLRKQLRVDNNVVSLRTNDSLIQSC